MKEFRFSARDNKAHHIQWRPWGDEAFQEAKRLDKPVLLEIVAYWCGACQRMDEVTFSNDEVIALINDSFVPVRVEEARRPDLEARYGENGWPTLAVLAPEGDHLFTLNSLGPYPMIDVMTQVSRNFHEKREELTARAQAAGQNTPNPAPAPAFDLNFALAGQIADMLVALADAVHGGYGRESKFPHSEANEFFLYLYEVTGNSGFLDHVLLTLKSMRESSMYHTEGGGGYYRYSSRPDWEEPHPEVLLNDQAGMLTNLLHAFLLTDDEYYARCARELIDYLNTILLDPEKSVFLGCQDYIRRVAGPDGIDGPIDSYLDECVYADQNARVASAYLRAWLILGREDCRERAEQVLEWLWQNLRAEDGTLYHYWDEEPLVPGLLIDATEIGLAMLDAYAFRGDATYLQRAYELAARILLQHRNTSGGYSDITVTGPAALKAPLTLPTQNARVALFFQRLAGLSGEAAYAQAAYWALCSFSDLPAEYWLLSAGLGETIARAQASATVLTLAGAAGNEDLRALARTGLTTLGLKNLVLQYRPDGEDVWAQLRIGDRLSRVVRSPKEMSPEDLFAPA